MPVGGCALPIQRSAHEVSVFFTLPNEIGVASAFEEVPCASSHCAVQSF